MNGTRHFDFDAMADDVVAKINAQRKQAVIDAAFEEFKKPTAGTTAYSNFVRINNQRGIEGLPPLTIDEFNAGKYLHTENIG